MFVHFFEQDLDAKRTGLLHKQSLSQLPTSHPAVQLEDKAELFQSPAET